MVPAATLSATRASEDEQKVVHKKWMGLEEVCLVAGDLAQTGDYRAICAFLTQYQDLANAAANHRVRADFYYRLGASYYALGRYAEAESQLGRALEEVSREPVDEVLRGWILVVLGHIHYVRGEGERAVASYESALESFGNRRDFVSQGSIYAGLSLAHRKNNDARRALKYAQLSVKAYRSLNRKWELAIQLNSLAVTYEDLGEWAHAREAALEGLGLAREISDAQVEAAAHAVLASASYGAKDFEAARKHAEAVRRRLSPSDASPALATSLRVLGLLSEQEGDARSADELFREALHSLEQTRQMGMYVSVARSYSELLERRGERNRALDVALEAARARLSAYPGVTARAV